MLVVAGVFAQIYLIGGYIFGAGEEALEAHRKVGFTVHAFEVWILLAALVAWLPRADLGLSLLMALGGTAQLALSGAEKWTGALHPLGALFVLVLGTVLVRRDLHRRRHANEPAHGAAAGRPEAQPARMKPHTDATEADHEQ